MNASSTSCTVVTLCFDSQAQVVEVPATDAALQAWLQQHGAGAVLLRPDRYIAGLATDAAALQALTLSLPWLKPPPADPG